MPSLLYSASFMGHSLNLGEIYLRLKLFYEGWAMHFGVEVGFKFFRCTAK